MLDTYEQKLANHPLVSYSGESCPYAEKIDGLFLVTVRVSFVLTIIG